MSTIAYFAGYIAKKTMKQAQCRRCQENLLNGDGNIPLDVIEAREYMHAHLARPGSYLYFITSRSLSILFHIIPRYCFVSNLSKCLETVLLSHIEWRPLNCGNGHELGTFVRKLILKCIIFFGVNRSTESW